MRNLLEEFNRNHGIHPPTILGVREHVFTGRYFPVCLIYFISLYQYHASDFFSFLCVQCIFFSIFHVKSRNQLCDTWAACSRKSFEVRLFFASHFYF